MPEHITLPSGATATLQDEDTMTNGQRKPLVRAFVSLLDAGAAIIDAAKENVEIDFTKLDAENIFELTEVTVAALVTEWSYEFPLPSADRTSLDDIPANDYDVLSKACMERFESMSMGVDPTKPLSTST